jgi:hypothetical protein
MKRHILALAFSFAMSPASGQGISIEGSVDCGMWAKARKETRSDYFEHWLLGTLNGLSLASGIEFWQAGGIGVSREQVFLWMDNYCQKHPLSQIVAGSVSLLNERTGGAYDAYVKRRQRR